MRRQITVYYALQSPWAYLGWARLREVVARSGAIAQYRPVQTGRMFEASGTLPLAARQAAPGIPPHGAPALA